jgi:peroxisomal enoyl-CoA hydratase 2
MTSKSLAELKAMVGDTRHTVEGLTIEAGKVEEFALAIKDDNPVFRDAEAAAEQGFDAIPAPLTFSRLSRFEQFQTDEMEGYMGFDLGLNIQHAVHGEQEYEFDRVVTVGDTLTGTTTLADVSQREGSRGGTMTFFTLETEFTDQDGERVVLARETVIETEEDD